MRDHEVDVFWCRVFCEHDEIALILTVLIITDDDRSSILQIFYCVFNQVESVHYMSPPKNAAQSV